MDIFLSQLALCLKKKIQLNWTELNLLGQAKSQEHCASPYSNIGTPKMCNFVSYWNWSDEVGDPTWKFLQVKIDWDLHCFKKSFISMPMLYSKHVLKKIQQFYLQYIKTAIYYNLIKMAKRGSIHDILIWNVCLLLSLLWFRYDNLKMWAVSEVKGSGHYW